MSTIIVIGAGPRPQARVVTVTVSEADGSEWVGYEVRDGEATVACFPRLSWAKTMLPLIQSGE